MNVWRYSLLFPVAIKFKIETKTLNSVLLKLKEDIDVINRQRVSGLNCNVSTCDSLTSQLVTEVTTFPVLGKLLEDIESLARFSLESSFLRNCL